jgi:hypothetical protein
VIRTLALLLLLLLLAPALAQAAPPRVEAAGPPPEALPATLRSAVAADGARAVTEKTTMEVWLRREPALKTGAPESLGASFGSLTPGALAGAVRFHAAWTDYHGRPVAAGLYTLRYAVQPADGYHMGVSAYRDFFLLIPATDDPGPGTVLPTENLIRLSRKSTGSHPGVLALFPTPAVQKPAGVDNEIGQPTLAIPYGTLTLGLVVEGRGEG